MSILTLPALMKNVRCDQTGKCIWSFTRANLNVCVSNATTSLLKNLLFTINIIKKSQHYINKKLYGLFLWMGLNYLKATEPLQEGSLLFTSKFPEISRTHLIDIGKMKDRVDLGAIQWFWTRDPWIGNPVP